MTHGKTGWCSRWRRAWLARLFVMGIALMGSPVLAQDAEGQEAGEGEELPITKLPELRTFVKAEYPPRALEEGIEASVLLEIDIDEEGLVNEVRVVEPATPEGYGFDDAATAAIFSFEFTPAETEAGPIPVTFTYRYNFVLEVAPKPDEVDDPEEGAEGSEVDEPQAPAREPVVNFEGEVVERGTRAPLVGVTVLIFRGEGEEAVGYEAVTDDEGRFEFYDVVPGQWKILIESEGYYPFRTIEEVVEGEKLSIRAYVERGTYSEFDVLVEGERVRKEVVRTLQAEVIEKIPGTYGDPIQVVQNLPGVARTPFGSGEIIVRGSSPEDTRVYIDGVLVPLIFHFGGLRSVVPLGVVDQIDFIPGNFSTFYGRATGGVLNVDLKSLRPERTTGYVDINLFDAGFYLEAPLGDDFSFSASARRSYIDAILVAVIPDEAPVNLIAAPRYWDFQVSLGWRPNNDHNVTAFFFGSDDRLELLFENPAALSTQLTTGDAGFGVQFMRGIVKDVWTPAEDFKNTFLVSAGYDEQGFNLGTQLFLEVYTYRAQLRDTMELQINEDMKLTAGLDAEWEKTDLSIRLPNVGPPKEGDVQVGAPDLDDIVFLESNDARERSVALFSSLELTGFDKRLLVIPGVRLDYLEQVDEFTFEPRVNFRYSFTEEWALTGGVGIFNQNPTDDETIVGFGTPTLDPEMAVHYSVGAFYQPRQYEALTVDMTLFYKDLQDLVAENSQDAEDPNADRYGNEAEGRVYGMEMLIKHNLFGNFFGWLTYTVSRSERRDPGESNFRLFDVDQTHILTLIGSYQLPRNWEISGRWRYVTGNPDTPIVGGIYNADTDLYDPIIGALNSTRVEPFHQLDLRVDKRWIYEDWTMNLYLDIQNAYNRSNVEGQTYNFDFSESNPQQGLPLLPVLGLKASF